VREAAYFVVRLAAEDLPRAGVVLNRVHGSGAARLSAERALTAAEDLDDTGDDPGGDTGGSADGPDGIAVPGAEGDTAVHGREAEAAENLAGSRIVDQEGGKAVLRNSPDTYGSSESLASEGPESEAPAPEAGSPAEDRADAPERTVDQLTAGLLRLHAERMQLLSREQRTRDRFTALHPEVAVAEVGALPGDVHDLAGLRDIGDRLAAIRPELPETGA
jgi:hypothetical protein